MPLPELFKYDVRVRERLQRKRLLTESEVDQHLSALADVAGNATEIELKQPALQTEAERAENSVIVRPAPPRPISIAAPVLLDDEEDEEDEPKPAPAPKVPAVAVAAAADVTPTPAVVAKGEDEDEDDDDDDDDEDEDEDEEDDAEGEDKVEPGEGGEPG